MSDISKKTRYEGQWWVPDVPEMRLYGVLTFTPEAGLLLELKVPKGYAWASREPHKVMHGHDAHGKPVTLFYCGLINNDGSGAMTTLSYHPGYCFHGAHFLSWSEAKFDEATVHFTDLEPWINITGFKSATKSWTIEYERPEELRFPTAQGFTLVFAASVSQHNSVELQSIDEHWLFRLEYKRPTPFKAIQKHLLSLKQFLTLPLQRRVFKTSFIARRSGDRFKKGKHWFSRDITCFTPGMEYIDADTDRKHAWELPFTFVSVRSSFEELLGKWLKYSVAFSDALSLFFSTIENKHLYAHHTFLFLAQALEVYHRAHGTKYVQMLESKADYRARMKRLTKSLEPDDARWAKKNLQWANQPTLNERLLEIFEDKRSYLGDFLGNEQAFAKRIKDLRNHFTHYTGKKGSRADDDMLRDNFELCYKMRTVMQVCILSDLGLPEHLIKPFLKKFDWTEVHYTETDEDEAPEPAPPGTPLLKAPRKRGRKRKKNEC